MFRNNMARLTPATGLEISNGREALNSNTIPPKTWCLETTWPDLHQTDGRGKSNL